jgi:hypothetical protein
MTFKCSPIERHRVYYREESGLFLKVAGHVKLVLEVVLIKSITPLPFILH